MTGRIGLRVSHVVPQVDREASGAQVAVGSLCTALEQAGATVEVHALGAGTPEPRSFTVCTYRAWPLLPRLGLSPEMARALRDVAGRADVMHSNSLWMMPNVYPAQAVAGTRSRLVTSPHGTLSAWALRRSRWRKQLMWLVCQGKAVRATDCFHATSQAELEDIRRLGLTAPVAVIPNGVEVPDDATSNSHPDGPKRLLFLGRVHPTKGVDLLLQAWRVIQDKCADWELQIAGPDNGGYLPKMQRAARDLALKRIYFTGPVYGRDKGLLYRSASLFVLPTHSENFGIAVAEALAHGVPVITTRGAPWQGLETNNCGWWIDCNVDSLADTLQTALCLSDQELREYGQRGRTWMQRDYSWSCIGARMLDTYLWLLGGGSAPDWVDAT